MTQAARAGSPLAYRADIDGLRGIAVLAVILFHADPAMLPGGYAGVDVFFVISGYLITRIVSMELQARQFSARRFFGRRVRRLAPALLLVLAACLPAALVWLLPGELTDFAGSIWAVSGLAANLFFWKQTGYFNTGTEHHPLLHTWSLSVEEQFYLLFALFFPLLWRHAPRRLSLVLLSAALLSLLASEIASRTAPALNFYGLPFRGWELLAGSCTALAGMSGNQVPGRLQRLGPALNWIALAVLALSMMAFDSQTPFPSLYAVLPVAATAVLLGLPQPGGWISRLLGWRPLVAIGLVSYSAYLWHQPVFTFARLAIDRPPGPVLLAALLLLTMVLAGLSWRFVEQPMRDRRRIGSGPFVLIVLCALLLVNAGAWWIRSQNGLPGRLDPEALRLLGYANQKNPRQMECLARPEHPIAPAAGCLLGSPGVAPTIAILGDSHADALFVALDQALQQAGLAARFMAYSGCPPITGVYRVDIGPRSPCDAHQRAVRAALADDPRIDTVIVASRWAAYLDGRPFDNGDGGTTSGPRLRVEALQHASMLWRGADNAATRGEVAELISAGMTSLLDGNRRVVLVYPIPEVGWSVPQHLARRAWQRGPATADLSTDEARYLSRNTTAMQALDAVTGAVPGKLLRIYPQSVFCGIGEAGRCMAELDGQPLYYDDNHLDTVGAAMLVERIAQALRWTAGGR